MTERLQLYDALRQADAAGDTAGAQRLAEYIQSMPDEAAPEVHTFQTQRNGRPVSFQAPADASDEQIRQAAAKAAGSNVYLRSKVNRNGQVTAAPDDRPTSFIQGVAEGTNNVLNHAAGWVESGLDALGNAVGGGDWGHDINSIGPSIGLAGSVADAEASQQSFLDNSPTQSSGAGKFAGEVAATLPLGRLPGGLATQGAAGGALLSNADTVGGVVRDAGIGAAGAVVGGKVLGAAARVVAPTVSPLAARLLGEDIRLTPGQIAGAPAAVGGESSVGGRIAKKTEDIVGSVPIAGAMVQGAQYRGVTDLNRAAVNRALRPIGERLPAAIAAGHDAIRHAGDRLSAAYNRVLPLLNGRADQTFARRLRTVITRADLPPGYEAQSQSVLNEALKAFRPVNPATGNATPITADQLSQLPPTQWVFNGRRLRDASERLGDIGSAYRASDDPYLRILGDVAQQVRDQLHALARRTNPASAARLRDIDRGYASLVRIERAGKGTASGIVTPRQYDAAVRGADGSARRRQSARGRALDQDLSSAASTVMGDTAAHGGSKDVNSLAALYLLGGKALAGDGAAIGGLGAVVGGSALYSAAGQNAVRALMARQPGLTAQAAARLLQYGSRAAPIASTAAIGSMSQQPSQ